MKFVRDYFDSIVDYLYQVKNIISTSYASLENGVKEFVASFSDTLIFLMLDIFLNQANPEIFENDGEIATKPHLLKTLRIATDFLKIVGLEGDKKKEVREGCEYVYEFLPT